MSKLKNNIIANFGGQSWSALLGLIVVPIYLHYMGMEAYGLIGFFASLQAILGLIDLGLSTTANRELSRITANPDTLHEMNDLIRTLEYIYFGVGFLIFIFFLGASGYISSSWLNSKNLPIMTVRLAIIVSGATFSLRWPVALFYGIFRGLERQVRLNLLTVYVSTIQSIGAMIVLIFISPSIIAFLTWQFIIGIFEVFIVRQIAWSLLPVTARKKSFDFNILKKIWRFSAGVGLISIFAAMLKQLDKIILSKILPLEQLGYYTTASIMIMGVYRIFSTPVLQALFPRLSSSFVDNKTELAQIFHKSSQMMSFITTPFFAVFVFFPNEILLFWTRSQIVASNAEWVLSLLAFSSMFNIMLQLPFYLLLAAGITRVSLIQNIIAVILLTPLTIILVIKFGIIGGAISWAIFNVSCYFIIPHATHRYVLKGHKSAWIFKDTLPFIVMSLLIFGSISFYLKNQTNIIYTFLKITAGFLIYGTFFIRSNRSIRVTVSEWTRFDQLYAKMRQFYSR